jgi:L-asparaginase
MIPYAFGSSSDGFFNLGCALAFVQSQPNGVYVTMQGRCFPWDSVEKDKKKGVFRKI